ncbi:conjugative transfer protein MobI(A/C) [Acidovorax sp. sic0104]|uniref:conjugative transfer protein MobI(A/C) n=1 Tax=Acidovorax sp. sic0104 TaxID=2854784 RepID=UPI001C44767C|nr:conjugative transfer protein MobI(A/C) [Acidovorax sp. sic0104]MBV7541959.1 hypothetical protein [Acidovorax sp. sic0104]
MSEKHERLMAALEVCLHDLHRQGVEVVADHWDRIKEQERGATSWEHKSRLQLVSHRQGSNIQLRWVGAKWYGVGANRKSMKVTIKRSGRDLSYTEAALAKWARDWELKIVMETEARLTPIRRQAAHYAKAIISARAAHAIATKSPLPAEDVQSDSDSED